jgi:hypothetical protein
VVKMEVHSQKKTKEVDRQQAALTDQEGPDGVEGKEATRKIIHSFTGENLAQTNLIGLKVARPKD